MKHMPLSAPDCAGEPSNAGTLDDELARLWPLLGHHVAFHRRLVAPSGSVKAALLLSQAVYWTMHGRDIERNGGWFYKTAGQWHLELGLTEHEQAAARLLLRERGFLEERRAGMPAQLHFRIAPSCIASALVGPAEAVLPGRNTDAAQALRRLLGKAVSYHRILAEVSGGVHAGLLLSRGMHLMRARAQRDAAGWFSRTAAAWEAELGLSRREQATARRVLGRLGLWQESLRGIPARLHVRIVLPVLVALLDRHLLPSGDGDGTKGRPECEMATGLVRTGRESSLRESHGHEPRKPPPRNPEERHAGPLQTAGLYVVGITRCSLHEPPLQPGTVVAAPESPVATAPGGGDLVFPPGLLERERQAARTLLGAHPLQAQELLDELAGRMAAGTVARSALGYLRGMVARLESGTFVPELAGRVAAAREARAREAASRKAAEAAAGGSAGPDGRSYRERMSVRRQDIRKMLDMLERGKGTREP